MDFEKLMSVASNKQKIKEKELGKMKVGYNTTFNTPATNKPNGNRKKIPDEKQKKLDIIRARVEAAQKKPTQSKPAVKRFNDTIMDFTGDGLSENDVRQKKRAKLSDKELAKKRKEFAARVEHLKANPIRPEDEVDAPYQGEESVRESLAKAPKVGEKQSSSRSSKDGKHSHSERKDKHESKHKHKSLHRDKPSSSTSSSSHSKDKSSSSSSSSHKDKHKDKVKSIQRLSSNPNFVSVQKKPSTPAPPPPVKKKKPTGGAPPMSFMDLINAAQENKKNPNTFLEAAKPVKKPVVKEKKKKKSSDDEEPERPMTQEEKERIARRKSAAYQRWLQRGGQRPEGAPPTPRPQKIRDAPPISKEIISDSSGSESEPEPEKKPSRPVMMLPKDGRLTVKETGVGLPIFKKRRRRKGEAMFTINSKEAKEEALKKLGYGNKAKAAARPEVNRPKNGVASSSHSDQTRPQMNNRNGMKPGSSSSQRSIPSNNRASANGGRYDEVRENVLVCDKRPSSSGSGQKLSKRPGGPPPAKIRPPPPPPDAVNPWDRIYNEIQRNHPRPERQQQQQHRGNVIESDEEYDSEMDDFIDDDDDMDGFIDDSAGGGYSSYISQIFKYDKNKYQDDDEDLADMEAGFAQQMKEEARSAKIGLMEDLEDMRQEEEELRRKKLLRMQAKKMRR